MESENENSSDCETFPQVNNNRLFSHEHPLLNPMLMKQILGHAHLSFSDLQNVRLVCRLWHSLSLSEWRQSAVLVLHREMDIFSSRPTKGLPSSRYLHYLVSPLDPFNLHDKPFTHYKFHEMTVDMGQSAKNPLLRRFWREVKPHMKYLHLDQCSIVHSVPFPLEKLVLEYTPNLEELVVSNSQVVKSETEYPDNRNWALRNHQQFHHNLRKLSLSGSVLPFPLPVLLRSFKKLEVLTLENFENAPKILDSLWETLYLFRVAHSGLRHFPIRELNLLTDHFMDGLGIHMSLFQQLRLPLEVLRVQVPCAENQQVLKNMLRLHAENLQVLEIFCPPLEAKFLAQFFEGEMPSLKELRLLGNVVKNLDFLKLMPSLEVLKIERACQEKWSPVERLMKRRNISEAEYDSTEILENTSFCGNTQIREFYYDCMLNEESREKVTKLMPALAKLATV